MTFTKWPFSIDQRIILLVSVVSPVLQVLDEAFFLAVAAASASTTAVVQGVPRMASRSVVQGEGVQPQQYPPTQPTDSHKTRTLDKIKNLKIHKDSR